jgi:hypothetical protein
MVRVIRPIPIFYGSCTDKPYSTNGSIHISYACSRQALEADPPVDNFYTRQLTYPVLVTVYHMLECYDMEISPCSGFNNRLGMVLGETEDCNWCLFSIEVRNTYGLPFEVTFERLDKGRGRVPSLGLACVKSPPPDSIVVSTCRTVPPGSTSRCVIYLTRFGDSRSRMVL